MLDIRGLLREIEQYLAPRDKRVADLEARIAVLEQATGVWSMRVIDTFEITGRGLGVSGTVHGTPVNGLVYILTPDGAGANDEVIGIEQGGPRHCAGLLLKHSTSIPVDSIIRRRFS
jgi:hypothetical protein